MSGQIACLGWGSLIWDPGDLDTSGDWCGNGPDLPVEFARESGDGRITLVLSSQAKPTRVLWAPMSTDSLDKAKRNLAEREGISPKNEKYSIGFVDAHSSEMHGLCASTIFEWAKQQELSGVVWTNLKCGFKKSRDVMPSVEEILRHFRSLDQAALARAKEYVTNAPAQIQTTYRSRIMADMGWDA